MPIKAKPINFYTVVLVSILALINLYLTTVIFVKYGKFVFLKSIDGGNLLLRFISDVLAMQFIPLLLIITYRKQFSMFALKLKSVKLCVVLILVLCSFFALHGDYSVRGFYALFFYVFITGFGEELLCRGYLFNFLLPFNRYIAILISGMYFGIAHVIVPAVLYQPSLSAILVNMLSEIGGGIAMGYVFIFLLEKSETLFVPILVHAILDYSYQAWGVFIMICVCIYFFIKDKKHSKLSCGISIPPGKKS